MALDRPDSIRRSDGPMLSAPRDEAGLPREVYALLAQANLLRMRGCWEEAVSNCMAALRMAPDSPSAQSLLGDIYENQGRFDDAIQWYRMALDANPESPADRLKLDRLLQRQQPGSRTERKAALLDKAAPLDKAALLEPDAVSAAPAPAGPAPTSLPLGRRLMQDPETALRCGALLAAALVCLVVVFAYAAVHRRAALASLGLAPSQEVKTAPVVVAPLSGPPAGSETSSTLHDSAEQAVLDSLRGSSDLSAQGITVDDLQFDPRASRMSVTISLPSGNGLTQAAVLHSALHTVQATAAATPSATAFTLRCYLIPAGTGGKSLIFVGDLSRSALPGGVAPEPADGQIQAIWTNLWWSPQMPGLDAAP